MKVKKITLVMVFASLCAFTLVAQPPTLGEDDFYFTGADLRNHPNYAIHAEGNLSSLPAEWRRDIYADGEYAVVRMGINVAAKNGDDLFVWRSGFQTRNDTEGVLRISKDYPVLAIKMGMPRGEQVRFVTSGDGNQLLCEYLWKNPVTGANGVTPGDGLGGKPVHIRTHPFALDYLGRDSIQYLSRTNNSLTPPRQMFDGLRVDDELAESVYFVDFSTVFETEQLATANVTKFQLTNLSFSCFAWADTSKVIGADYDPETGNIISYQRDPEIAKSYEEYPTYRIKWVRAFANQEAFYEFVAQGNGDGPPDYRTNAQKALAEALRKAYKDYNSYSTSNYDLVNDFFDVIEEYNAYYENTPAPNDNPASAEWIAWDETMATKALEVKSLNVQFIDDLTFKPTEYMYKIQSAVDGRWLAIGTDDVTSGSVTGKSLVFVNNESGATPFFVTATGANANGIPQYTFKANGYYLAMMSSTIFAVPENNRSSATIDLTFMNRDEDYEYYGIKLGWYHVFSSGSDLARGGEDYPIEAPASSQAPYKFMLEPFAYVAGSDPEGFIEWTFDTPGDTEGWKRNNSRPWIEIEQGTYSDAGCLVHKATETYEPNNTNGTQITAFPTGLAIRREAGSFADGQYPNEYELTPISDAPEHRPEDYLVLANSGVNRYFAIKAAASDPEVSIATSSSFTFYKAFGDNVVLNFPNAIEKRGDVFIFDLLAAGMPPGGERYVNQYMGSGNHLSNTEDRIYIDWMRTYKNLSDIPSESFATSIPSVTIARDFTAYGTPGALNIQNYSNSTLKVDVFSVDGKLVKTIQVTGSYASLPFSRGIYIVRGASASGNYAQKVIVK